MSERESLYDIKMKLIAGIISYDEAKMLAEPFINSLNEKGRLIANKHGRKFIKTSFSMQMR